MSSLSDNTIQDIESGVLSNFVHEFNVARRHVLSYPGNHPIIAASSEKVLTLLRELLGNNPEITIGIAKDTLIAGDSLLDKSNHAYRNLARLLFSHGIATITFSARLTAAELINFCKIISVKREAIDAKGGIAAIMKMAAITGITLTAIDYSAFLATESGLNNEQPEVLPDRIFESIWQEFVVSLLQGTLVKKSDLSNVHIGLTPAELAEMLNKKLNTAEDNKEKHVSNEQILAAFIQHLEQHPHDSHKEELLRRLNALVSHLSPDLRNQLLSSVFKSLAEKKELAEAFLSQIPEEAIIDTLDAMILKKESLPPMLFSLIGKLSSNLAVKASQMAFELGGSETEELKNKLRELFREESHDKFTPESYQAGLNSVLTDKKALHLGRAELETLKQSLNTHSIENQVSRILLDIINNGFDELGGEIMLKNLVDLSSYFLSCGDFAALMQMYDRLSSQADKENVERYHEILQLFNEPDFVLEVIQGITFWGKTKYQEIGNLIIKIGASFIGPILDRLAEEQNMSLRRYYMDILQRIGDRGREEIIARLRDNRWYFVRNLVLILRNFDANLVIPHIRRLTNHPHSKVKQEAIKALLFLQDSEADRLLLRDFASGDRETVINAVRLAEQSKHAEVIRCLTDFLTRGGLSGLECELKSAVIHSLSMIGSPTTIPVIESFLRSRSLFRSKQLNGLKIEAVRSLNRYPKHLAVPLLNDIIKSGHRTIRESARETIQGIQGGES
ncbi:hypothetical protein KI809_05685 [Geobacter pelophilus]|uniref:HEAT repeat domain-containing protein n=1 Tax=Geoanaerobacter pelophilus TaxID=60036 RepID=A0AAW4L702_9BACT|nr:hypothetical protein [Geoanaerobacter pelophilus]MBT0663789.1 hypothetical protein [Geoanaerobacter pelophilus]